MQRHFDPYARNYASLSVKDLLDAREVCHVQFRRSSNVFATAIGLYRIRAKDDDGKAFVSAKHAVRKRGTLGPRTLENTVVKPWSWPCVLVFVREWLSYEQLKKNSEQPVPPFIFLPDGRVAPICILKASLYDGAVPQNTGPLTFSSNVIGGGYPVVTDVQGKEHVGSIACLVTDGERYYGLTNQHVAGAPGREVFTLVRGNRQRIGVAAGAAVRKAKFTDLYPRFAGSDVESNLDIGLIDADDISLWTAQVFGLGVIGPMMDFDCATASLDWIGLPLVAHGARAGRMEGEIKALFYRYSTLNGTDYVSDFLIGGRGDAPLLTGPGDSGTLWCIDPAAVNNDGANQHKSGPGRGRKSGKNTQPNAKARLHAVDNPARYQPIAVEWGGQKLAEAGDARFTQYGLASSISAACHALDVEIVTDLNVEHSTYWGPVGHYKIAELATNWVTSSELRKFLADNLAQLSYNAAQIATGKLPNSATKFVPLADVPDVVWKTNINRGGKAARPQENWNHYVDLDLPDGSGKTISDLCGDPPRLSITDWIKFYRSAPVPARAKAKSNNMGALPFRVWQIFDAMVEYRKKGKKEQFLCAAGILAHYVGDACQPLHGSMHSDGIDGASTGVHEAYEEKMIDKYAPDIGAKLDSFDPSSFEDAVHPVANGYEAGQEIVRLIRRTAKRIPPRDLCNAFEQLGGGNSAATLKGLWDQFGTDTLTCIADGTRTLAMLWDAAYAAAKGSKFQGEVSGETLKSTYEPFGFLPSVHMANLDAADFPIGGAASVLLPAGASRSSGAASKPRKHKAGAVTTGRKAGARKTTSARNGRRAKAASTSAGTHRQQARKARSRAKTLP